MRRITRYRYNNVPPDSGGRYVYLRDNASGEYWSPSWQPTQRDLEHYEFAYFACSEPLTGFDTEREAFPAPTVAGTGRWPWSAGSLPTRSRTGGRRTAVTTCGCR